MATTTTVSLTGNVTTLVGEPFAPGKIRVLVESSEALTASTNSGGVRLNPRILAAVSDEGDVSITGLPVTSGGAPLYKLIFEGMVGTEVQQVTTGWFELTQNRDFDWVRVNAGPAPAMVSPTLVADVTAIAAAAEGYRDESQTFRDQQAAIAGLTGEDTAVAALVNQTTGTSATRQAVNARVASTKAGATHPVGLGLVAALDMGRGDTVIHVAGDSTGNDTFEWVRKFALGLAARYGSSLRVQYRLWDDVTQSYPSTEVLQAGTVSSQAAGWTILTRDTFSRTASDLYGTTPDVSGANWSGGSNAAGDWSIDGTKIVRSSDATTATITSTLGATGDTRITLTGITMKTQGDTANRTFNVAIKYIDASNYLWLRIQIAATTGAVSWNLFKTVAGVNTNLATGAANPIAANAASVVFNAAVSVIGDQFSATLTPTNPSGSASTLTATLAAGDVATFAAGDTVGFSSSAGTLAGMSISDFQAEVNLPAIPGYSVTVVNGSMPGATLAYHQARIAAMFPQAADLLIVSMGHNYNATDGAAFTTTVSNFVTAYQAVRPNTPVAVSSQNPEFTDGGRAAGYVRAHALRFVALRPYALTQGWGYIPVFETFASKSDGGRAYVNADGIHMNYDPTGPLDGGDLWASVAGDYFAALSLRPV